MLLQGGSIAGIDEKYMKGCDLMLDLLKETTPRLDEEVSDRDLSERSESGDSKRKRREITRRTSTRNS